MLLVRKTDADESHIVLEPARKGYHDPAEAQGSPFCGLLLKALEN